MVAKAAEEIQVMRDEIAAGILPRDAIEKYLEEERKAVFGVDYKKDRQGRPIETGIGAPGNTSENHFAALAKYEGKAAADAARAAAAKRAG